MLTSFVRPLKFIFRDFLNAFGFDIVRYSGNLENTLAGYSDYPFKTVIDIGASTGQSAKHYRQMFPLATIHSFEPLPSPFAELNKWAKTQDGYVKTYNCAIGASNSILHMNHHVNHSFSSSILDSTERFSNLYTATKSQEKIEVVVKTLDDALENVHLEPFTLMKLDVQGYEKTALQGAVDTLSKVSLCILEVSVQPLYVEQSEFFELVSIMQMAGFRYEGNTGQILDDNGKICYLDALFVNHNNLSAA